VSEGHDRSSAAHVPVLADQVVAWLEPSRGGTFVDCTLGLGGHTRRLLEAGAGRVIGIDRDPEALARARGALAALAGRVDFVHADFRRLDAVLDEQGVGQVEGVLADLGVSSMQLDEPGRGMSFRRDEPLDMRMDQTSGPTAAERLATVEEGELADVIYGFGEERHARRIARAIVRARAVHPVRTTGDLAAIVRRAVPGRGWQRIDPATRTFQALRIWINGELEGLDAFLAVAASRLRPAGRLAVIAFHSLEDRIVKHTLRRLAQGDEALVRVLTKRPLQADEKEVAANPRARSAKLRVAERLAAPA
jgi:16S rRNA (cytosine1402-N4)-methyltransferase